MKPLEIGKKGEDIASKWFLKKGYSIVEKNYRYGRLEIDIIAKKKEKIYFIEVKTRTNSKYGFPEEAVSAKKMNHMKKIAEYYMEEKRLTNPIFFSILAIVLKKNAKDDIYFIEDVY